MNASDFAKYLQRMLAITDTGLTFTKDPFDRERYEDLRILLSEMLNQVSDLDAEEVAEVLKPTSAYVSFLMDNFKKIKKLLSFNFLPLTNCQSYLKNASPRTKWRFSGKFIKDKETNMSISLY